MIREKQDQNISGIRIHIDQIIVDCSSLKPRSDRNLFPKIHRRLKTEPSAKFNLKKSLDFDTCVKNINTKVRSLRSAELESSQLFQSMKREKFDISGKYKTDRQTSPIKSSFRIENPLSRSEGSHLPRLLAKYHKAFGPQNASSSQKYLHKQKQKPQSQDNESKYIEKYESFQSMVGQRKRKQEMSYIRVMGRVVKQNIVKEKKVLQERKKKRRLQNLKMKQIYLFKSSLPNL